MPVIRKSGLAGEIEDRVTADFIKLVDLMENQRSNKKSEVIFRENYRQRSIQ
jgi:hypothetical protein